MSSMRKLILSAFFILISKSYFGHLEMAAAIDPNSERENMEKMLNKPIPQFPWPFGNVPFTIDESSYDDTVREAIMLAIMEFEHATCLKFATVKDAPNLPYLYFTNRKGRQDCDHNVYMPDAEDLKVPVVLGYNCLRRDQIMHSILHGLGFNDENQHPRRDYFINVFWNNIIPEKRHLFRMEPFSIVFPDVPYDFNSIMHFSSRQHTRNGRPTITAIDPGREINPSTRFSDTDLMKLQLYFGTECRRRDFTGILQMCIAVLSQMNGVITDDSFVQTQANVESQKIEATIIPAQNVNVPDVNGEKVEEKNDDSSENDIVDTEDEKVDTTPVSDPVLNE